MTPIMMNLLFFRSPQKPKEEGIYWCIIKSTDQKLKIEYGYDFVEFKDKEFNLPADDNFTLEVAAWCELSNPEAYFKPKPLIIRPLKN